MDMPKGGTTTGTADSGAYTDLNRLSSLKYGDRDSEANLRKVAQEFESVFVGEMLKSMRSANNVFAEDNPMNSPTVKQYQDMYDQQLAVSMSHQGNGIGLQNVLMRQLSKTTSHGAGDGRNSFNRSVDNSQHMLGAQRDAAAEGRNASVRSDMAKLNERRLQLPSKAADRLLAGIVPSTDASKLARDGDTTAKFTLLHPEKTNAISVPGSAPSTVAQAVADANAANATQAGQGDGSYGDWTQSIANATTAAAGTRSYSQVPLAPNKAAFKSPDEFIATMMPMAQDAAARIGVDPSVLVAQAALETGWGKHMVKQADGSNSNNLFGIKSHGWDGGSAPAVTQEFVNGKAVTETAKFRTYDSFADSFHDYVNFLQSNDRYDKALSTNGNSERFMQGLQQAGYATDPHYARKVIQIARNMNTYQTVASLGTSPSRG